MQSRLTRWCDGFLEAGWLLAVIVTPLFFNIHSERVFEPDKLTLLRSIALLMALVWLVKFIDQQGWRDWGWLRSGDPRSIWRQPFVLPVLALVVVYLISTALSVAPRTSMWGSYQRLQGTYTTLSYIVIFAVVAATLRTRQQVQRLVTTIILTSLPVSLYGVLQRFQLDPLPWGGDTSRRIAGHMGNAIFIGAYLIMAIPLTAVRIIDSFYNILTDETLAYADVVRSSIYILTLALQVIALYFTQSRGPILGIGIGLFAFVLILLVALRTLRQDRRQGQLVELGLPLLYVVLGIVALFVADALTPALGGARSAALFGAVLGVLVLSIFVLAAAHIGWRWLWLAWILIVFYTGGVLLTYNLASELPDQFAATPLLNTLDDTFEAWQAVPTIGRLGGMLDAEAGTSRVRVLIWSGALELIRPHAPISFPDGSTDRFNFLRPLFGYGPEAMYVAYNAFYPPELATIEARNASPDRSHNETFDALVITGVAGFVAWQILYLATFYYGLNRIGVVRDRRDRNLLVAFWVAGAAIGGLLAVLIGDAPYLGIAVPFGSILGLVLYLVVYALTARGGVANAIAGYDADLLLLVALVAALIAYYVEIHFGIAIAATRTHAFIYTALIFVVGYALRSDEEEDEAPTTAQGARRARRRRSTPGVRPAGGAWSGPVLAAMLILAAMLGTLIFNFTSFTPQPGEIESWTSAADLPSSLAIIQRALLVNPRADFIASPYLLGVVVLTWLFGALLFVSELIKDGTLRPTLAVARGDQRERLGAAVLLLLAAVGVIAFVTRDTTIVSYTTRVAGMLALLWAALSAAAGVALLAVRAAPLARHLAGGVATLGVLFALPLLLAGSPLYGLALGVGAALALYLLWDPAWNGFMSPLLVIGVSAFMLMLVYALAHGGLIRASFITPTGAGGAPLQGLERRIVEAERVSSFLSVYYGYVIVLLIVLGLVLAWRAWASAERSFSVPGGGALVLLLALGLFAIDRSNLNVVQADMTYKRGRPFDQQATQLTRQIAATPAEQQQQLLQTILDGWKSAIAIYERVTQLAPNEDFYYLWLGRAYLEESSINAAEQQLLLETAEARLIRAQTINPLNTDHTANLARLNVRWAGLVSAAERETRVALAERYYEDALALSPQNSIIRNEYASLALTLGDDCAQALAIYEESLTIDPYYDDTYLRAAEAHLICAERSGDSPDLALYAQANGVLNRIDDGVPARQQPQAQAAALPLRLEIARAQLAGGDAAAARATLADAEPFVDDSTRLQVEALLIEIEAATTP